MRRVLAVAGLLLAAAPATARAGDLFSSIDAVAAELRAGDAARRRDAVDKLDAYSADEARPLMLRALGDSDPDVRAHAAATVGRHHVIEAVPRLTAALGDADPRLRAAAAEALGLVLQGPGANDPTPEANHAVDALERALGDGEHEVREAAVVALGRLPPALGKRAAVALTGRLDDEAAGVRQRAAEVLGHMGEARAVVPLLARLGDTTREVRAAALEALAQLDMGRRPPSLGLLLGLGITYFTLGMLLTSYLRNFGYRGRRLRTQLVMLGGMVVVGAGAKAYLLLTPLSPYLLPIGAFSIAIAVHHDRQVAFASTVALAFLVGSLIPFDLGLAMVLLLQGFGAVMFLTRPRKSLGLVQAGLGGGLLAMVGYLALYFLVRGHLPAEDTTSLISSGILAACGGGVAAGLLATIVAPLIERALGEVPRSQLVELTDLNHPLLKRIAQAAPGTWAHSLAMANMAELAATAIGANALLTRVGAYFHDLGKSSAPQYYIENLHAGEPSPHDTLDPDVSADAIFAHCTEGVRLGRAAGVPEPVLDFMHMHHGNGLLEYFWHKNQEQGNPKGLSERHFRYPGLPPQTKETAILAICDAVEAASRTLKNPSERDLTNLVQRIVFGKLRLGQLDQSGLTSADLKALCNSLVDTLKNSFHVRIEYPWQKEERAAKAQAKPADGAAPASAGEGTAPVPVAVSEPGPTLTQRILVEERLDSADSPRPTKDQAKEQAKGSEPKVS